MLILKGDVHVSDSKLYSSIPESTQMQTTVTTSRALQAVTDHTLLTASLEAMAQRAQEALRLVRTRAT